MVKKLFMLFKIGRKLSTSGAISSIYEIYNPPILIKILFFVIGFNIENNRSWDFELFADMYKKKFKFKKVDNFLGAFRIYSGSLTGKFILKDRTVSIFHHKRMYKKYFSSEKNYLDHFLIAFSYIFDRLFNLKFIFRKIYDYYFSIRRKKIN